MNNKDNDKKIRFWTNVGWVICIALGLIIGNLISKFLYYHFNRGESLSRGEKPAGVLVSAQSISSDNSESVHLQYYPFYEPPETEGTEEVEMVVEETEKEVDPAEAERLANWKANFPYKPTTDPDVVITEAMLQPRYSTPVFRNHGYMRHFFENETRFTAQFEQLYRILEEHGRADNPMVTGNIFEELRLYQKYRKRNLDEPRRNAYTRENRHPTYGEGVEDAKERIWGVLHSEKYWPARGGMPEDEAIALRDRIINEIQGVDKLPDATKYVFLINGDYGDELKAGDSPLVISQGWQASYDEKFPPPLSGYKEWENLLLGVDENNVLLNNGKPMQYREGELSAGIITPDGYEVPLLLDEDGKMIIPTPTQIEEMIQNGEAKLVRIPQEGDTQPPQQLTEEEWRLQEAQRMLQEASRQQE